MNNSDFKMGDEDIVLKNGILYALDRLYNSDFYLINVKADELAIEFRFAHYFQSFIDSVKEYAEYSVDCEYNRNLNDIKYLPEQRIRPDLIFHQRGNNYNNLLVIEFKTYWNNDCDSILNDINKLKDMTSEKYDYKYRYGLFIIIGKKSPTITVYRNSRYFCGEPEGNYSVPLRIPQS